MATGRSMSSEGGGGRGGNTRGSSNKRAVMLHRKSTDEHMQNCTINVLCAPWQSPLLLELTLTLDNDVDDDNPSSCLHPGGQQAIDASRSSGTDGAPVPWAAAAILICSPFQLSSQMYPSLAIIDGLKSHISMQGLMNLKRSLNSGHAIRSECLVFCSTSQSTQLQAA